MHGGWVGKVSMETVTNCLRGGGEDLPVIVEEITAEKQ